MVWAGGYMWGSEGTENDRTTTRHHDNTTHGECTSVRVYDRTKVRWDEKMSRLSFRRACEEKSKIFTIKKLINLTTI